MIEEGWVDEIKQIEADYGKALPLLKTLGYAELQAYLRGHNTLAQAQEETVIHTRQFAKRQRTWFRGQPNTQWYDPTTTEAWDQVSRVTLDFLKSSNPMAIHDPKTVPTSS